MSFAPALSIGGLAGWSLLKRGTALQQKALQSNAMTQREVEYFKKNISGVKSVDDLIRDRQLLKVALVSFGLEGDIGAKAFLRKILSDGTESSADLASRLADKRYLAFAKAFAFDAEGLGVQQQGFADKIITQFHARRFETAVGEQQPAFRLALNAERDLAELAAAPQSDTTKWFTIMGNKPLRAVFETAFSLPASFGRLDIDHQLREFKHRTKALMGSDSISQFSDPVKVEKLVKRYLLQEQVAAGLQFSPAQNAVRLLATSRR